MEMDPHKDREKTLTRMGIEPTTFGLDHRCYKVRREQAVGTEDAKVPAMNNDVQVQGRVTFLQTLAV